MPSTSAARSFNKADRAAIDFSVCWRALAASGCRNHVYSVARRTTRSAFDGAGAGAARS